MNKLKIFNDPVYGFVSVPYTILFDLLSHPYFQRLRRIKQLGLSDYVYPGALHTRFHHAIGSLHLMHQAISVLRNKGVEITDDEAEAVCIAILLHDIGHSPFSHALEGMLIPVPHEQISLWIIEALDQEFNGRLTLAQEIFTGSYSKKFLHQLVSSQLDMDRLDYLTRDSFFTGVAEGIIGYDRIIKMLHVVDDELVVEEKGIHSIERFLMSRHFMYWQVYLHKTVIAAEQMVRRFMELVKRDFIQLSEGALRTLLSADSLTREELIYNFVQIDDYDVITLLKRAYRSDYAMIRFLAEGLLHRKLLKCRFSSEPIDDLSRQQIVKDLQREYPDLPQIEQVVLSGSEHNTSYREGLTGIKLLMKDGGIKRLNDLSSHIVLDHESRVYYLCHPPLSIITRSKSS